MSGVTLQFLGSGDAFGSGGRFNTCMLLRAGGSAALIDCGASSLVAMNRFGVDPNGIETIFISHLHGDHFGGLPFFLLHSKYLRRPTPLTIAGPPGLEERVRAAREVFFPGSSTSPSGFEVLFLELEPGARAQVNGTAVTPYLVDHLSGAPSFALRLEREGKTVTYSGDTAWCEALIPASQGADLFVIECSFLEKTEKQHIDLPTLTAQREKLSAQRVVLTHMGAAMLEKVAGLGWEYAEDGKVFQV